MRDGVILGLAGTLEKNVGRDISALNELNLLCRTRIGAHEEVLFGKRGSLLWAFILSVFAPRRLRVNVEEAHEKIMSDWNKSAHARALEIQKEQKKKDLVIVN